MDTLTELYRARINRRYYEFIAARQARENRQMTVAGRFWLAYLAALLFLIVVLL